MRLWAAAALALVTGCGSGSSPAEHLAGPPQWVRELAGDERIERAADYEGHEVWVRQRDPMVFIADCAAARRASSAGGPYGPIRSDQLGGPKNGYAFACLS